MNTLRMTAIGLGLLCAQSTLAHTELEKTIPGDRAMIEEAPEHVQLAFSEPVRLTALTIQMDGAPKRSLGPLPSETTESFSVALPDLSDGHYVVTWRALSEDTHVMNGEFMFAIGVEGDPMDDDDHMDHDHDDHDHDAHDHDAHDHDAH